MVSPVHGRLVYGANMLSLLIVSRINLQQCHNNLIIKALNGINKQWAVRLFS